MHPERAVQPLTRIAPPPPPPAAFASTLGPTHRQSGVAEQGAPSWLPSRVRRGRENSWEGASKVVNVRPLNLVDKPTADPPFRLVVNGIPMNEHYNTWRIRYEGVKTVPLAVTRGCWLFSIDLADLDS